MTTIKLIFLVLGPSTLFLIFGWKAHSRRVEIALAYILPCFFILWLLSAIALAFSGAH